MTRFFNTIEEMEAFYYGGLLSQDIRKADAPVIQSTSDWRQVIFGGKLWSALILSKNLLGALPKRPWDKSGYRVVKTAGATSGGGVVDGAATPDTLKPTPDSITVTPKMHARTFDEGVLQLALTGKDDVVPFEEYRKYTESEFLDLANRAVNTNVTTTAGNNFESIDRVCSSYAEVTNCGDVDANDSDIYGEDRDAAASFMDAYVDHNSNTDRTFDVSQVDTVLQNVLPYSQDASQYFIYTGLDTYFRWGRLLAPRLRFGEARVKLGVNGVEQLLPGAEGGIALSSYQSIPILTDPRAVQDTLSRVYTINGETCWFATIEPTRYSEVGGSQEEQQLIGKLAKEGMFTLKGEIVCTEFPDQGKVRDLK